MISSSPRTNLYVVGRIHKCIFAYSIQKEYKNKKTTMKELKWGSKQRSPMLLLLLKLCTFIQSFLEKLKPAYLGILSL